MQSAATRDLGDHFSFELVPNADHPTIDGDGIVYGGHRFQAKAFLANKAYGEPFGVDAGAGDILTAPPEVISSGHLLGFG